MIPSQFTILDSLPLNPAGKVDRRRLPEPDPKTRQRLYIEPRNETERAIATVWQEVLKVDKVGVTDNFFEMGGNSLKAAKATFMIANMLGVKLTITDFFRESTVEAIGKIAVTRVKTPYFEIPSLKAL
jgi:hypothetical protein